MLRPNSVRSQLSWLLLVCITLRPGYAQEQQTVAQLAGKIDSELAAILSTSSSTKKQEVSASLLQQLTGLKEQSIMVFGSRRQQLEEKLQQLIQSCEKWQSGSSDEAVVLQPSVHKNFGRRLNHFIPRKLCKSCRRSGRARCIRS